MSRKTDKRGNTVSMLFTMLLFLVFVLCALFTMLIDSWVYENINMRSDASYIGNTAFSYIANKICQSDRAGTVNVVGVDGIQMLEMKQEIGDSKYVTWIYWDERSIQELFTDTSNGPGLTDSLEILECQDLKFSKNGRLLRIGTVKEGGESLELSLRGGGLETNE